MAPPPVIWDQMGSDSESEGEAPKSPGSPKAKASPKGSPKAKSSPKAMAKSKAKAKSAPMRRKKRVAPEDSIQQALDYDKCVRLLHPTHNYVGGKQYSADELMKLIREKGAVKFISSTTSNTEKARKQLMIKQKPSKAPTIPRRRATRKNN
jgi:hypothetical protein